MAPSGTMMKLRLIFSSIGILVGLSILLCFAAAYHNYDTAVWGFVSGLLAAATLYTHIRYVNDKWRSGTYMLRHWMLIGCISQLAAICGFVAYIVIAINENQALTPYGPRAYYLTTVWCFMSWKWGFLLFYYARDYKRCFEHETGLPFNTKYEQI